MLGRISDGTTTHAALKLDISDASLTHSFIPNIKFYATGIINVLASKSQAGERNTGRVWVWLWENRECILRQNAFKAQHVNHRSQTARSMPWFTILYGASLLCISLSTPSPLPSLCHWPSETLVVSYLSYWDSVTAVCPPHYCLGHQSHITTLLSTLESSDLGAGLPWFHSLLHHFLAVWFQTTYRTSLCFSFLTCEMRIIIYTD